MDHSLFNYLVSVLTAHHDSTFSKVLVFIAVSLQSLTGYFPVSPVRDVEKLS
jgi:hypothetical protein